MRLSTALLLAAIALLAVALWGFRPEAVALAWHVQHGMHADGAGLRVRVPLLYTALEGPDSLILMSQNGRVRTHFGGAQGVLIFISKKIPAPQGDETVDQWWKRTSDAIAREGARQASARTLSLAGRTARCAEFEGGFLLVGVDIWCVPETAGGWFVDYNGPRAHVSEFYSLLAAAQAR